MKISIFGTEILNIEGLNDRPNVHYENCTIGQPLPVILKSDQPVKEVKNIGEKEYFEMINRISEEVDVDKSKIELILKRYDELNFS